MKTKIKLAFALIILFIVGMIVVKSVDSLVTGEIKAKVTKTVNQQLISSSDGHMSTKIRYLVITDKETFVVENALLQGKFNNSDIFFNLEEGKEYTFKVAGFGKSFITDYRNILEAK